jgi:hypothetical protein
MKQLVKMRIRNHLVGVLISIIFLTGACVFPFTGGSLQQDVGSKTLTPTPLKTHTSFQPNKPTATSTITSTPTATRTSSLTPTLTNTGTTSSTITTTPTFTETPAPPALMFSGAGDISICGQDTDDQTAALLRDLPGDVFTLGDNQNDNDSLENFQNCFEQSWGQYKDRMIPVIGNHEYYTENASGFFSYFGELVGPVGQGYYSRNLGDWHIIALNSNCNQIGGCGPDSDMARWLEQDLQQNRQQCTIAMWHAPRWSSGWHGNDNEMDTIWRLVAGYGVELVLNGHDHFYERFAPMNKDGVVDYENGTRNFIVGTGGASLRGIYSTSQNSEVIDSSTFGVMNLSLGDGWYSWKFIPVSPDGFTDSGTQNCH